MMRRQWNEGDSRESEKIILVPTRGRGPAVLTIEVAPHKITASYWLTAVSGKGWNWNLHRERGHIGCKSL